jgi:hypothetical protein
MGSIEQIDQLETYIIDLGNEIESVKKASDYLKLIEHFQEKIAKTSDSLSQSKEQLRLYQEIMESKLELFQTTSKNIEAKQQSLEQSQFNILTSLAEMKQQQEKNEKGMISSFMEMNKVINKNQITIVGELKRIVDEQQSQFTRIFKANKMFFTINSVLSVSIVGILVYLISR